KFSGCLHKLEEMRSDAADLGHGPISESTRLIIAMLGDKRQREDGGIVLGGAALVGDLGDRFDGALGISLGTAENSLSRILSHFLFGRVVAASLVAQDEKPLQSRPVIDGEAVSAC